MVFTRARQPKVVIPIVLVLVLVIGGVWHIARPKKTPPTIVVARKIDLVASTSVTGRVKPAAAVDLAFERVGRIARVVAVVGDRVSTGQPLVSLDNAELAAGLAQSEAALQAARAGLDQYTEALARERVKLEELKRGTRLEELTVSKTKVATAEKTLADAAANLKNVEEKASVDVYNLNDGVTDIVADAYAKADDAVNKQADELFDNDATTNPTLTFSTDGQMATDAQLGRVSAGSELHIFRKEVTTPPSPPLALDQAERHLRVVSALLLRLTDAVNAATNLTLTTRATYKANLNTARTNINTAITAINKQRQLIAAQEATNQSAIAVATASRNAAEHALETARAEYALKLAGSTLEQILAQEAQVRQADANRRSQAATVREGEARIATLQTKLAQGTLRAPFDGMVTRQEGRVGEIATTTTPLVALMSEERLQIEANVPEADIAKVRVGEDATATLDAYMNDVIFGAKVIAIDPAETIIDGVATYKTTLEFINADERVKPGMTANVDIIAAQRSGAVAVPSRAVFNRNGEKFVRRIRNGITEDVVVRTGLVDAGGSIEVLDGIQDGDVIVLP